MSDKILIADDSAAIQKVIKIAFSHYDVDVLVASSYIEAKELAGRERPKVVIADATLIGSNGAADIKKLQTLAPGSVLLLLLGTYETINEEDFKKHGIRHFLKKPFDVNDIIACLMDKLGVALSKRARKQTRSNDPSFDLQVQASSESFQSLSLEESHVSGLHELAGLTPPSFVEKEAKGLPAFQVGEEKRVSREPTAPPKTRDIDSGVSSKELKEYIKEAVSDYCRDNFKEIAKEIITKELRRLADEKSQFLVD